MKTFRNVVGYLAIFLLLARFVILVTTSEFSSHDPVNEVITCIGGLALSFYFLSFYVASVLIGTEEIKYRSNIWILMIELLYIVAILANRSWGTLDFIILIFCGPAAVLVELLTKSKRKKSVAMANNPSIPKDG